MYYLQDLIAQWGLYSPTVFGSVVTPYADDPTTPLSDLLILTADFPDEQVLGYLTDPANPLVCLINFTYGGDVFVGTEYTGGVRRGTISIQGFLHTPYPQLRDDMLLAIVGMYQKNLWLKSVRSVLTPDSPSWIIDSVRVGGYMSIANTIYSQSFSISGKYFFK